MFFKSYPTIAYLNDDGVATLIRNIMVRANISESVKSNDLLYFEYDVKDGETPESISYRLYGDKKYHWVIMLMNNVRHIHCDWVRRYEIVVNEAKLKYGDANLDEPHHYVDTIGNIVHPDETLDAIPVSNLQFELDENESKRKIKILNSRYIGTIEKELKRILKP